MEENAQEVGDEISLAGKTDPAPASSDTTEQTSNSRHEDVKPESLKRRQPEEKDADVTSSGVTRSTIPTELARLGGADKESISETADSLKMSKQTRSSLSESGMDLMKSEEILETKLVENRHEPSEEILNKMDSNESHAIGIIKKKTELVEDEINDLDDKKSRRNESIRSVQDDVEEEDEIRDLGVNGLNALDGSSVRQIDDQNLAGECLGKIDVSEYNTVLGLSERNELETEVVPVVNTDVIEPPAKVVPIENTDIMELETKVVPIENTHVHEQAAKVVPIENTHVHEQAAKVVPIDNTHVHEQAAKFVPIENTDLHEQAAKVVPIENTDVIEIAEKVVPIENTDLHEQAAKVVPIENTDVIEIAEKVVPIENTDVIEQAEKVVAIEKTDVTKQAEKVVPIENTDVIKQAEKVVPIENTDAMELETKVVPTIYKDINTVNTKGKSIDSFKENIMGADIVKDHANTAEPETNIVTIDKLLINTSETTDVPINKEHINTSETTDVPIGHEHVNKSETTDVPIDKEPNSISETTHVPIDKEPISESETEVLTEITDINAKKEKNIRSIGNKETTESYSCQGDDRDVLHSETYREVNKIKSHHGVTVETEAKTYMLAKCVDDEQPLQEEMLTPTPQDDTTRTSFGLETSELATSSLSPLKQSADGVHGLVSCNIEPHVLGVISEISADPSPGLDTSANAAMMVSPKTHSDGEELSPIREDLENFESVTSSEEISAKCREVHTEVEGVVFKERVENINADLEKNEKLENYADADNAPRDKTPSNVEPDEEVTRDDLKDENSRISNADLASSQCPPEDRAQMKVNTPAVAVQMSRMILLISSVVVTGVVSAVLAPFLIAAVGFEAGSIVQGSFAESLMELSSSMGFGMCIIDFLEAAGNFDVLVQFLIGLLSGGIVGGVFLAAGMFRDKVVATEEESRDGDEMLAGVIECRDDVTTIDHDTKLEDDFVQGESRVGEVASAEVGQEPGL